MALGGRALEQRLEGLLAGTATGLSVERLRTGITAGGTPARKDEIVAALRRLSEAGIVEIGVNRRWRLRKGAGSPGGFGSGRPAPATGGAALADGTIHALPATVAEAPPAEAAPGLPDGNLVTDLRLLERLMPYYRAALGAADGGAPIENLRRAGETFALLRPDRAWWPRADQPSRLRIPRRSLPNGLIEALARSDARRLHLGYPLQVVDKDPADGGAFFRPVATVTAGYSLTEAALTIDIPARAPALNPDWIRAQQRDRRWTGERLRRWLLVGDEEDPLAIDDEADDAGFLDMAQLAHRLDAALRRNIRTRLDPASPDPLLPIETETGLYNAISLTLDTAGRYTRSAIGDYDRLLAGPGARLGETALAPLVGAAVAGTASMPVLHPFPMSESQLSAARAALAGPLTVVTGPPGTGKSQVIASIMISAAAAGRSVLFAARQHRALDAVQDRLNESAGDRPLLVRANDAEQGSGFTFGQAIQALLTRPEAPDAAQRFTRALRRLDGLDRERRELIEHWQALDALSKREAALLDEQERLTAARDREERAARSNGLQPAVGGGARAGWVRRLLARLAARIGPGSAPLVGTLRRLRDIDRRLDAVATELQTTEAKVDAMRRDLDGSETRPIELTETLATESEKLVPVLLDKLETVGADTRRRLTEIAGDTALQGKGRMDLPAEAARMVLDHLPLWAVTTLAAGSRIPLEPGLFDYVVFDEAAQTDIASAVPLLYRARNAVIVGDPQQLTMISNLDPREERDLLAQHDLLRPGIGRFAQGRTTLFDLAASSASARRFMLTEHYRCHPDIAGYINEAFYGRRLAALTDLQRLRIPHGTKPGLHWTPVTGTVRARSGGGSGSAASDAEADAVVEALAQLVDDGFSGSIGVVTFFDYQAQLIQQRLNTRLPAAAAERHNLRVFTANKFQGDERDVILMSLCLAPNGPPGARFFINKEKRLLNVAVSRARAVCHVFGDLDHAAACGIPHVEALARRFRRGQHRPGEAAVDDRFDSPWEKHLHDALVARGVSPIPQYAFGGRFLDLALIDETATPARRLDIEVDGVAYHQDDTGERLPTDLWRDHQLRGLGWTVLRFWVHELRDDMERCVDRILSEFRSDKG
jgi:very-short-patch-repair endonuclease